MIRIAICDDDDAMCRQLKQTTAAKLAGLNQAFDIVCYASAFRLLASYSG